MKKTNIDIIETILGSDQSVSSQQREQILAICKGKPAPITPSFLKASEAAKYLSVSLNTFYLMRKSGKVKAAEISPGLKRYKRSDLDSLGN